jgi:hypothetical protein
MQKEQKKEKIYVLKEHEKKEKERKIAHSQERNKR